METDEPELTSCKLSDISKIPAKDFEKQFRQWMERDDVARSLQAKLRYDLISNFNKTTLGRHIMSRTTMTTGGGVSSNGMQSLRLTLSPIILALNTLVAEFLYAQNCHFSLSIFCTEVPFRNTLPNFEQSTPFRFTNDEIQDVLQAIFSHGSLDSSMQMQIMHDYAQLTSNNSLMLILMQALVKITNNKRLVNDAAQVTTNYTTPTYVTTTYKTRGLHRPRRYPTHFRKINKYLGKLTNKVEQFVQIFQNIPQAKESSASSTTHLNKKLSSMAEQLRKMPLGKQYFKQLNTLEHAITQLSQQFKKNSSTLETQYAHKAVNTVKEVDVEEKPYAEWVHELRETRNGKKFLDRIENSLRKALNNQKMELQTEANMKLEHQKTILKIRYRQKLLDVN